MDEDELIKAGVEIATEVAKDRAAEIYGDALKPAAQEAGGALQSIVGLFNHVVLYPVKKANISFRYKLEQFERDLKEKLDKVPREKLTEPPLAIAGPTLESLKYTYDTDELREMYLELLASAMNVDKIGNVHPAFVEVIKAMSPMDAHVFRDAALLGQIPCARVTIGFGNKIFTAAMPELYAPDLVRNRDPFVVSKSIQNLCRLGLLTHRDNTINGFDYEEFRRHSFVEQQRRDYSNREQGKEVVTTVAGEVLLLNDFGRAFKAACFS